jgi:diguanylate cyclase (GGDEF)-like protein
LPKNIREFKRMLAGEIDSYRLEQRLLCKDQRYAWTALSVVIKRLPSRQPDYNIVVIDDIAAQKEAGAARALQALEEKLAAQGRKARDLEEAGDLKAVRIEELTEELRSLEARLKEKDAEAADAQKSLRETQEALKNAQQDLRATQATLRGAEDAQREAQDLHRESQAALQTANARLVQESATDQLTVLANRRTFSRRGEQAANALRQSRKAYGLILLDLDDFKQINEEYGHDVGDDVLRGLGTIMNTQLRNSSDMAARLGGDEFAVLCFGDINEQTLHDVAERIHGQMGREPIKTPKGLLRYTGSFGLALSNTEDTDWKTVYARADAALREAKTAGKDRISFGRSQSKNGTARLRALSAAPPAV